MYKEKWIDRLAMEKSDKLDGSKGFEILYLCHPQTGQARRRRKKNKSRTLWGTTTTTRGSCWELHTAHVVLSVHPSTYSSQLSLVLSVLSVNYMALATETRSYPPPIFILFFTDSRLRKGGEQLREEGRDVIARNLALLMWIKKPPKFTH